MKLKTRENITLHFIEKSEDAVAPINTEMIGDIKKASLLVGIINSWTVERREIKKDMPLLKSKIVEDTRFMNYMDKDSFCYDRRDSVASAMLMAGVPSGKVEDYLIAVEQHVVRKQKTKRK